MRVPTNPLDVLAQQVVATTALEAWPVDDLYDLVRRSAPFANLPRSAYDATLDLLSGRYPSDEFAELRPRVVWDRVGGTITGRPGAQRLAVTSGGTIPDRGLFGVFLVGEGTGRRVGELDEEMVYESRVGDVFALGATSWRIEDITHDRVMVTPAPGIPGRLPFWKGDTLGRPAELGEAIGEFTRELGGLSEAKANARAAEAGLDAYAAANLVTYVHEQVEATRILPSDRNLLVERFRDELGDWRLVVHSPYGVPVHAPWALAINARLRERYGVDGQAMASDDGIVIRIPDTDVDPPSGEIIVFEPDEIDQLVTDEVGGSALFAARFRECAARALLLPRRDPGRRSPLWQQRQRAAQLLEVATKYPSFPIVLEAVRECLQDVYDLPALVGLMKRLDRREVSVTDIETQTPSPYARTLLFGYVAQFVYEGDSPIAERRAAALSLDQGLLAELLGRAELRELLDPEVLAEVEAELQRLVDDRKAKDVEGVADLLRLLGPLSVAEITARTVPGTDVADCVSRLADARRAALVRMAGGERWTAVEDIGRLRDALGVPVPPGIPDVFTESVEDPLGDLVARYARTHGPFTVDDLATSLGLGTAVVRHTLQRLGSQGRVLDGEFRPAGTETEWCDAEVLRRLRRRSLARLRQEVEPVDPQALARFLPAWQSVADASPSGRRGLRGVDGVLTAIDQLAGAPVPASALEQLVLAARVRDYEPAYLDELTAAGEVIWAGQGDLPGNDGWVALHLADQAPLTLAPPTPFEHSELHQAVLDSLAPGGAWFFRQLSDQVRSTDDRALAAVLWDLVWAGRISNDTLTPLRALIRGGRTAHRTKQAPARSRTTVSGRSRMPSRGGPPETAGRWAILPALDDDPTRRAHAVAERLLDRHGVVTRGAVMSERVPGGFAAVYKVLSAFEETGRCRRGYFVGSLGAAQFGTSGSVDRLRTFAEVPDDAKPVGHRPGGHRPRQPVRRRPPLARPPREGRGRGRRQDPPPRPQGRRPGGAGRRRPDDVRRARRQDPPHLARRRRRRRPARARRPRPGRGRPSRRTRPDHRRARRRRAAPRLRSHPAPARPERGRVRLDPPRPPAARRISGARGRRGLADRPQLHQALSGHTLDPHRLPRPGHRHRRPLRRHRRGDGLARQAPAHPDRPRRAVDAAHPPQDGGLLAGLRPRASGGARPATSPGSSSTTATQRASASSSASSSWSCASTRTGSSATSARTCSAPTGTPRRPSAD